jgi:hypothetical protein
VRFAPIRLAEAIGAADVAPFACAFELRFPYGLTLRAAHGADSATLERLAVHLRGHGG